ncbi:ATP-binding protein [soil metagenome]
MNLPRLVRSTSFRYSALYAALFVSVLLIVIVIIYVLAGRALHQQIVDSIQTEFTALEEDFNETGETDIANDIAQRIAGSSGFYYGFRNAAGTKHYGNLIRDEPVGWAELPGGEAEAGTSGGFPSRPRRLIAFGKVLNGGSYLVVGQDAFRIDDAQNAIISAFGWSAGIGAILSLIAGLIASHRFLSRVDSITSAAQSIIAGNLDRRIATRGTSDEFDRMAANLNTMLDRIQSLMQSLQQVSTSIAHDLRTPLARLQQGLDTALWEATSVEEFRSAIERGHKETESILEIFSALLRIAQIESGSRRSAFQRISLSSVFARVAEAYEAVAEDQGRRFTADIAPGIEIDGDAQLLVQMLSNVMENALQHTGPGTPISVRLAVENDQIIAEIADRGEGIREGDMARVFERFYRADASRMTPGYGLGLTTTAAVAELHGIEIELRDNFPGLRVIFRFAR